MPDRFDQIIQQTLKDGTETHHDVSPADFGTPGNRRMLFTRCIALVAERYPQIRIKITGDGTALQDMGLTPNGEVLAGMQVYRTQLGTTSQPGQVRLSFSRRTRS